jgi:hypothetical protein
MAVAWDGSAATSKTMWANATAATCLNRQYHSAVLPTGTVFTTAHTQKCYVRCMESATNDNINRQPFGLYVMNGTTLQATLSSLLHRGPNTTEWNTSLRGKTVADGDVLTAGYTTVADDYLMLEIGGQASSAGGTSVTGTQSFGADSATDLGENETDTAANNPWFEISLTINWNWTATAPETVGVAVSASEHVDYLRAAAVLFSKAVSASATWVQGAAEYVVSSPVIVGHAVAALRAVTAARAAAVIQGIVSMAVRDFDGLRSAATIISNHVEAAATKVKTVVSAIIFSASASASRATATIRSALSVQGVVITAGRVISSVRSSGIAYGQYLTAARAVNAIRSGVASFGNAISASMTWVPYAAGQYVRSAAVIMGAAITSVRSLSVSRTSQTVLGAFVSAGRGLTSSRTATAVIGIAASAIRGVGRTAASAVIFGEKVTASRAVGVIRSAAIIQGIAATGNRIVTVSRSASTVFGKAVSANVLSSMGQAFVRTATVILAVVPAVTIEWISILTVRTLRVLARIFGFTLRGVRRNLTLQPRTTSLSLRTRTTALSLTARHFNLTLQGR